MTQKKKRERSKNNIFSSYISPPIPKTQHIPIRFTFWKKLQPDGTPIRITFKKKVNWMGMSFICKTKLQPNKIHLVVKLPNRSKSPFVVDNHSINKLTTLINNTTQITNKHQ